MGNIEASYRREAAKEGIEVCKKHGHAHMLALYTCINCDKLMCHECADQCIESDHRVLRETTENTEEPHDEVNVCLNIGMPVALDLTRVSCPCGEKIAQNDASNLKALKQDFTLCCVCGTVTCSSTCHAVFVQDTNKCHYAKNFIKSQRVKKQGCRCIKFRTTKELNSSLDLKLNVISCMSDSCFIQAEQSESDPYTLVLRRGYRQYGQPSKETLSAMCVVESENNIWSSKRVCTCRCEKCTAKISHPIHACCSSPLSSNITYSKREPVNVSNQ